jgi:putative nucleotidyltransferase with HDIG domain
MIKPIHLMIEITSVLSLIIKVGVVQKLYKFNSLVYVCIFILSISLTIWLDGFVFPDKEIVGLYTINLVIAGSVFWRYRWNQVLVAGFITIVRYKFAINANTGITSYLFTWFSYMLTILFVSTAIRFYIKQKESTLNLTLTLTLAKTLDSRDNYTAYHSQNVAYYALCIAKELRMSKKQLRDIYIGGLLHDIGKIGVPESVLTKPSKLTNEEYEIIKQHPKIGFEMVQHIPSFQKNGVLDMILYHHEHYNGKGYPKGLIGEEIPMVARIMAVADAFDALTSKRVYRPDTNFEYAVNETRKNKGTQFDSYIADVFLRILERQGDKILYDKKSRKNSASLVKTG